jgi:hypothetical protein
MNNLLNSYLMSKPLFDAYIDCLIKLHEEMARDEYRGNDEGDGLREKLMEMEPLLNGEERRWVHNLGGDLYMLYDQDMYFQVPAWEIDGRKTFLFQQIRSQNWLGVLDSTREALGLPKYAIALYRGMAWREKSPKISLLFFKHADKLLEKMDMNKRYKVTADHSILARPDKIVSAVELESYKFALRLAGYENIAITEYIDGGHNEKNKSNFRT